MKKHMQLGEYLRARKMTQMEFAVLIRDALGRISIPQGEVSAWARGQVMPRMAMRKVIEQLTGGVVRCDRWGTGGVGTKAEKRGAS